LLSERLTMYRAEDVERRLIGSLLRSV